MINDPQSDDFKAVIILGGVIDSSSKHLDGGNAVSGLINSQIN